MRKDTIFSIVKKPDRRWILKDEGKQGRVNIFLVLLADLL